MNTKSSQALAEQASTEAILKSGLDRWANDAESVHGETSLDLKNVFGLNFEEIPQRFRIKIPTVHIYGNKDPRCPASLQLVHFSSPELRRTYDHGGGHDVPRKTEVSESVANLVQWAASVAGVEASVENTT